MKYHEKFRFLHKSYFNKIYIVIVLSYAFYFLKESKSKSNTFKFYAFRFHEKWAWIIIIISIHFLFRVIYVNMAHVSNRLKFDTFLYFHIFFENGINNEWNSLPQKKSRHLFDKNSQMTVIWYNYKVNNLQITFYRSSCLQMFYKNVGVLKGVLKNITNFTRKHLCQE